MGPRLVLRGWGGELLRRDASVASKRKRKKEAYSPAGTSLQGFVHRHNYPCELSPVGECLQVLAPQTFSLHSRRSPLSWCRCQADDTVAKERD